MPNTLHLEIVTPDRVVLSREVEYVAVPGVEGEFGVLPGHTPFLSAMTTGCLRYKADGATATICLSGGFAEVNEQSVLILADSAEAEDEIDLERAEKARQRAQERLAKAAKQEDIDMTRAEASLKRSINRINAKRHSF